jgi:hypothetical protein
MQKRGFRKVRWPARLGWDEPLTNGRPTKLLPVITGVLCALAALCVGLIIASGWIPVVVTTAVALSAVTLGEALPATKERYEVVYSTAPSWKVGEDERDRDLTDVGRADTPSDQLYPDDYAGRVLAVKKSPASWRPGDLASPNRQVAGLDLTLAQVDALKSKQQKVDPVTYTLGTVTVEDRYGATLPGLVEKFGSTAGVEAAEVEAEEKESSLEDREPHAIRTEFVKLKRALPKNVVHSGAGLYEVGPGKTYSTIQSALDQLWTDQGAATFAANQYIRIFADTYTEDVAPNASLNPDENNCRTLIIEGDPADDRDNIISRGSASRNFNINCDHAVVRHMRIEQVVASSHAILTGTGFGVTAELSDIHFVNASINYYVVRFSESGNVLNSVFDCAGVTSTSYACISYGGGAQTGGKVHGCVITAGNTFGINVSNGGIVEVSATAFSLGNTGICVARSGGDAQLLLRNCTFYRGEYQVYEPSQGLGKRTEIVNCIFKDAQSYVFWFGQIPEETAGHYGLELILRNNYYHGYATFARITAGAATKTFAQIEAANRVDASGQVDGTDPLLTDPASDDFSLQSGSPCRHAGHGSGVTKDVNGDLYDPYHPDIGAVSTGIGPNVAYST